MTGTAADWSLVLITALVGGVPAFLAAGALWVRVSKLESTDDLRVTREVFNLRMKHLEESLRDVKRLLFKMNGFAVTGDTDAGQQSEDEG